MDNSSNNSQYVSPLRGPGFLVFNVVMLLAVVLPVIAANTVLLVALVLESSTVKVVRLVLGSILVSCLLAALGLAMYHISGIILNLLQMGNPPTVPCTITLFLISFGGAARLEFAAAFAITVYIVKSGRDTKKHAVVLVFLTVVTLWMLAFIGASPLLSQNIVHIKYADSVSCGPEPISIFSYIFVGLYGLLFGLVPLSLTIMFLVITVCFIKHHSHINIQAKTAMVKFAFFLLFGNGINLLGQFVPSLIATLIIPPNIAIERPKGTLTIAGKELIYTAYTLLNLALIPTPILITIYFKPIRKRLCHWLCCCMQRKAWESPRAQLASWKACSISNHVPEEAVTGV